MTSTSMTSLYGQLKSVGISRVYAKKVLPAWWEDSIASTNSGLQQAQLYFSRAFNIDLGSLNNSNPKPSFQTVEHKFKLNRNVSEDDVAVGAHYVTAMAKIALKAMSKDFQKVPKDATILRAKILEKNEFVNLNSLLDYCAEIGIPVLHVENVPGKKMTGIAIRLDNRFAIVLSKAVHPAYLLFHLAHEIGHIAMEHLTRDGFIVDVKAGGNNNDADENEADAYAIRLLNGAAKKYTAKVTIHSGKQLYQAALSKAVETKVDVGHIILNFANTNNCFPIAAKALKYLNEPENGASVVNNALFNSLNSNSLSDEQLELLHTATGYDESA